MSHSFLHDHTRPFLYKIVRYGFLQAIVFGVLVLTIGSLLKHDMDISNVKILYVDYDGGAIGTSIRDAHIQLRGKNFPSLVERPASEFLDIRDLEMAVCYRWYHAAISTSPRASDRLKTALAGRSDPTIFNRSDVLIYAWNKHLYPNILDSIIMESMQTLGATARTVYIRDLTPGTWSMISQNPTTIPILTNPWDLTPTHDYANLRYSFLTATIFLIFVTLAQGSIILEAANLLCIRLVLRRRTASLPTIGPILVSAACSVFGSLFTIGAFCAFCPNWPIDWYQFLLFWAVLWLFSHVNFLVSDALPLLFPSADSSGLLAVWIILNIASASLLLDFTGSFSNWANAMPAYQTCKILIDIWTPGCGFQSFSELVILVSFEVLGLLISAFRVYKELPTQNATLRDETTYKDRRFGIFR